MNFWLAGALIPERVAAQGEVYRLLTAMFLHGSLGHIFFNAYAIYFVGRTVEPIFGRVRYLLIFLLGGFNRVGRQPGFGRAPKLVSRLIGGGLRHLCGRGSASLSASRPLPQCSGAAAAYVDSHRHQPDDRFCAWLAHRQLGGISAGCSADSRSPGGLGRA